MIRHVVLFRWDDEMTEAIEQQVIDELNAFAPGQPGVRAYRAGPDAGIVEGNWDFAVVGEFDDVNSYLAYRDHPTHQDIITRLSRPHTKERASVQYEV
jgi:hypothetical protein